MKNTDQTTSIDRILDNSKVEPFDKLILKNLKGGKDDPPPTVDDFK